jgi:WD40 repeat protein
MNIEFLDPFESFPNKLDGCEFPDQHPYCCAFDGDGSYLALGSLDGTIYIVDFATRGVIRRLQPVPGHTPHAPVHVPDRDADTDSDADADADPDPPASGRLPITSVCWTPDQRLVLSGSMDGTLLLHEAETERVVSVRSVGHPIRHVQVHPRAPQWCLVCCYGLGSPLLVHLGDAAGDDAGGGGVQALLPFETELVAGDDSDGAGCAKGAGRVKGGGGTPV